MQADPAYGPWILEPVEILGVDAFRDWSVVLKMRIKTVPLKQWDVGREFRKRIQSARSRRKASRCRFRSRVVDRARRRADRIRRVGRTSQ